MQRAVPFLLISLLIIPFLFSGCAEDSTANAMVAAMQSKIATLEGTANSQKESIVALQNQLANKANAADIVAAKASAADALAKANEALAKANAASPANVYTKEEVDSKISALKSNQSWITGSSGGSNSPVTPTGSMGYVIVNPQPYYQFSSSGNFPIDLKITNNRSDSRYVRPQISITAFSGSATVGATATATVISSTQGQTPITFQTTPTGANVTNNAVFIAIGGGVNGTGEYLIGSGTAVDVYLNIVVTGGSAVLWNITVTGSDRAIQ